MKLNTIIISAHPNNGSKYLASENWDKNNALIEDLKGFGLKDISQCVGHWQGSKELSILVQFPDYETNAAMKKASELIQKYDQECYLLLSGKNGRQGTLETQGGKCQYVGQAKIVDDRPESDCYTEIISSAEYPNSTKYIVVN